MAKVAGDRRGKNEMGTGTGADCVITAYSDMVYRLAYAMMKNRSDADDVYQEVFLRYIRRRPVFQSPEHARAWMLRVTVNCCKNHWKSPWADGRMSSLEEHEQSESPDPESQVLERRQQEELRQRIGELPEGYRLVIHLYYYEELSTVEIARLLHRRTSTVRTQLARAREKLRALLDESRYADVAL